VAKALIVNPDRCTGCGLCEMACSMRNTGEFNPSRSRIQVISMEPDLFRCPVVCVQCHKAPCAEICPESAISRDDNTGTVKVDKAKCTGCRMCEDACPFGVIIYSELEQKAVKCELCDGDPQCVLFCPTQALEFKEPGSRAFDKKRALAEKLQEVYKLGAIFYQVETGAGKTEPR